MRIDPSRVLANRSTADNTVAPEASKSLRSFPERRRNERSDAAVTHLGHHRQRTDETQVYKRPKVIASEPVAPPTKSSVFKPGSVVEGKYGAGTFATADGVEGKYFAIEGGHIGFEVDGFKGILTGNKAVAFNPKTGESYSMTVRYGGGKFQISDIEPLAQKPFEPGNKKPLIVQGENKNIKFDYNDSGELRIALTNPETGEELHGEGFLLPNGTYTLAFSNGAHIIGNYAFNDEGNLMIYNRKPFTEPPPAATHGTDASSNSEAQETKTQQNG